MRREYIIGVVSALAAVAAFAAVPCPPELTAVATEVAELRNVPPPFSPPCRVIPAGGLTAELDRKLTRDLPVPPVVFVETLVRIGMVDGDAGELYRHLLDFYASQVLGFYEPEHDEMVLVSGSTAAPESSYGRLVWSHELEHAAQEHRFHLPSRLLAIRHDGDAQRAASAIAEGEAMLVMLILQLPPGAGTAELKASADAMLAQTSAFKVPAGIPDYFAADLLFPYTAGLDAVLTAYRSGGWTAVDGLLARPPRTTAALLYPSLPPASAPVDAAELPPVPPGWDEVLGDTLGAWAMRFWLSRVLPESDARSLAAEWDGDYIRLVRNRAESGCWGLAWRLRCRSESGRAHVEAVLQRTLPGLLARLCPGRAPLELALASGRRTLDVRAGWPSATSSRPASPRRPQQPS